MQTKRTNIEIDQVKINKARKLLGLKTNREIVDYALGRLVDGTEALRSLAKKVGKIQFDPDYDYKANR